MKVFFTSLFICLSLLLNAQIQKGDFYLGTSFMGYSSTNIDNLNIDQNSLRFSPLIGLFVTNSTMVSLRLSPSFTFSNSGNSRVNDSFISIGASVAQYFGKKNIKGLTGLDINLSSFRSEASLRVGGAFFFNDFSAVELTYNLNLLRTDNNVVTDYFVNGLRPVLGLTLKSFLLRNREGVENLAAINSISIGTWRGNLSGSFSNLKQSNSFFLSNDVSFFFKDYLFAEAGLGLSSTKFKQQNDFRFNYVSGNIGIGYYLPIKNNFFGKFAVGLSGFKQQDTRNIFSSGTANETVVVTNLYGEINFNLGIALFLGRHKIEPGLAISFFRDTFENIDFEVENTSNLSFALDYEYFLSSNLSLSGKLNVQPNNSFRLISSSSFASILTVTDNSFSSTNFNAGFNWYF